MNTRLDGDTEYSLVELSSDPGRSGANVIRGRQERGRTETRGLFFGPLVEDQVWEIGATGGLAPTFCWT